MMKKLLLIFVLTVGLGSHYAVAMQVQQEQKQNHQPAKKPAMHTAKPHDHHGCDCAHHTAQTQQTKEIETATSQTATQDAAKNDTNTATAVKAHTCVSNGHVPCTECICPGYWVGCFAPGCSMYGNHNHIFQCSICKRIMTHNEAIKSQPLANQIRNSLVATAVLTGLCGWGTAAVGCAAGAATLWTGQYLFRAGKKSLATAQLAIKNYLSKNGAPS